MAITTTTTPSLRQTPAWQARGENADALRETHAGSTAPVGPLLEQGCEGARAAHGPAVVGSARCRTWSRPRRTRFPSRRSSRRTCRSRAQPARCAPAAGSSPSAPECPAARAHRRDHGGNGRPRPTPQLTLRTYAQLPLARCGVRPRLHLQDCLRISPSAGFQLGDDWLRRSRSLISAHSWKRTLMLSRR
jgi:hypothetical protein